MAQENFFKDTKPHFEILDGLRGIAAVIVVAFHLLETFTLGNHQIQIINHGYLAVDFFFGLSGFVIGYAYDEKWQKMTISEFFKRRLIRLHPMIIVATIIGALLFYIPASEVVFPAIANTPVWKVFLLTILGFLMIPVGKSLDIRGWDEMYPLNGPAWSLFYEYVANIFYALFLRKISNKFLMVLVFIAGAATIHYAVTSKNGDMAGGWSLAAEQVQIGITRLIYPFLAGLLLSRIFKPRPFKNAFLWCTILIAAVLSVPRIGGSQLWENGLYEALSIIFIFPFIIYLGANGKIHGKIANKVCSFLGDISYPIYIIHYPFIYIFTAYAIDHKITMVAAIPMMILFMVAMLLLSYILFKIYDIPIRKYLTKRFH